MLFDSYSRSPFQNILGVITYFILPIAAIIWPFIAGVAILKAILWIFAQLFALSLLNLLIEKLFDNDDGVDFFVLTTFITLYLVGAFWPFVVCPWKLAIIFSLASMTVISIALKFLSEDLDFLDIVIVVLLSLLAAYWPWIVFAFSFKIALIVFIIETGVILTFVGLWTEIEGLAVFGILILSVLAVGWPWFFVKYNIAIIIILAELFLLAFVYEIFKGFSDEGIVKGMLVFFLLLAVGWPWLAFMGMEKYLFYAIPACIGSGVVAGFVAKILLGFKNS